MNILHISAECYPIAKVGGLADVVGTLPKYLNNEDVCTSVIMPRYNNEWSAEHEFETVFKGHAPFGPWHLNFQIQREVQDTLGFPLRSEARRVGHELDCPSWW